MSTGRLEPQDETENVSGVFYDYSERSSLSSPPAERPDGEKKRKSLTCPDVLDGSLQAAVIWQTLVWTQKEISTDQMTKAGSVNVFTR